MTPSGGIHVDAIVERLVAQGIDTHVHGDGGVVVADVSHSADNGKGGTFRDSLTTNQ